MKNWITPLRIFFVLSSMFLLCTGLFGQLSVPSVNSVYGGRINGISVISTGANTSRVFIATESANSVFYADVTTTPASEAFGPFTVMPGLGDDDGYGSAISKIYAHQASGYLFFIFNNNLYKTHPSGSAITTVSVAPVNDFIIYGDYLFYIKGTTFYYALLDGTSALTATKGAFTIPSIASPVIRVNPSDNKIYIASLTSSPAIYVSNDTYTTLSSLGSSFSTSASTGLSGLVTNWRAFGIGPDGTLFLAGDDNSNKYVQYSEDGGANWSGGSISVSGVGGPNLSFAGSSSPYKVFFAKTYATYTTASGFGAWTDAGSITSETHPNDGASFVDPNNDQIIYVTTDQGIGATKDGGPNLFEIDDGVAAVQVNDFSMNSGKTMAYLASKAGVRKVTSFSTSPVWTKAMFPNNDGSPYYSAEMENDNDAVAYVGNLRIYKTTNSGASWTNVLNEGTTTYSQVGTRVEAIEVCPRDPNLVLAGFYVDGASQGGLWYSTNAGGAWTQLKLRSTATLPSDVDVYDIAFTVEGGKDVAYIGVYYNLAEIPDPSDRGYSIYRAEWDGAAWTVREDMQSAYTSTGSVIVATIKDIDVASSGTMIYACGNDAGTTQPVAYYKDLSAGTPKWTPMPASGFPSGVQTAKAISSGGGNVYCAADNVVYTIPDAGTSWAVGYTYPAGTDINVLFYDDLLVGTGTGLYSQTYSAMPVELTSFTSAVAGSHVTLSWTTATEVNNFGFALERKQSASNWNQIAFIPGAGTSNAAHQYSYTDMPTDGNKFAYRLKQIDRDGSYKFSQEVEAMLGIAPETFTLAQNYPNPFNPSTMISYGIPADGVVRLAVYDMLGRETALLVNEAQHAGSYKVVFDASRLAAGTYVYKLQCGGRTLMKKLSIVK